MKYTYIENQKVKLFLSYSETDSKNVILFIHGYPDTHKTWDLQIDSLKEKFRLGAIDLRGFGRSSKPLEQSEYNYAVILPDLVKAIDFLSKNSKVHIVGHDWGATLGWLFISDSKYSKYVNSFTAISGPHPWLAGKRMIDDLFSLNFDNWKKVVDQSFRSWYIWFFQIPILPELMWQNFGELIYKWIMDLGGVPKKDFLRKVNRNDIYSTTIAPINLFRELLFGRTVISAPSNIKIPVQLIIPQKDFIVLPEVYENTYDYVDNLEIHKLDSNHWVHREQPNVVTELIRKFVSKHSV
ncbi:MULTISPECIES: alpha/beta fold hydrolase [Leptospira]|uniref:alpha/beta fold hydrolase n=1 Tax=Leptospira TaxID=171 RepID=UPI0002FC1E88|nr:MULTISPECIES: alpha/beta fold hydrolase [Leptospira]MCL8268426.1 alpha/beta fold hydrolase [Leptospira weilii]MDL5245810.1 alpha/beta fold hydrolase [Leptospira weilii]OMI16107.1 alpha/beta hydrolase [Leptospira weilii serovar Heyan]QDK24288.1 alpha/beta fold hydrolase [Leptospira weilii]QDK28248.1 alpha/beta fold hydrolase [Leptospira weilii]